MYKLKNKIENTKEISIIGIELAYVKSKKFYIGKKQFEIEPMLYKSDVTNNNVWIKDTLWENYLINISEGSIKKLNFNIGLNGDISSIITIFKDNKSQCLSTLNFNATMDIPKNIKDKSYLTKNDNFIILDNCNRIYSFKFPESKSNWELKLSSPETINHQYGIWQEELLIGVGDTKIIAVDIHSGTIAREWEEIPENTYKNQPFPILMGKIMFKLYENKLIGCDPHLYIEINLINDEINIQNLDSELIKISANRIKQIGDITDSHLYMTVSGNPPKDYREFSYDSIIAINRTTFKIDWHHTFSQIGLGTNSPKIGGNKLYQLDLNQTLHVFEKEKSV